jgi:hypothetical protein
MSQVWNNTYDVYRRLLTVKGPRTNIDTTTTYTY